MRDDVQALIENRPAWRLLNDQYYQDLLAARQIAQKENDLVIVDELNSMITERKDQILNGISRLK
jgi:archaellum biogenesis ATPase FlaH